MQESLALSALTTFHTFHIPPSFCPGSTLFSANSASHPRADCSPEKAPSHRATGHVSEPGIVMQFSLCKIAPSESSRAGAGTWRRQVQSMTAPRCRRIRVQRESTRIRNGEQWPGRTCRPRLTLCVDGPASLSARQRPRGQRSGPDQEPHGAPGGTVQRREEYDRGGRWTRGQRLAGGGGIQAG